MTDLTPDWDAVLERLGRALDFVPLNLYDEIRKPVERDYGDFRAALDAERARAERLDDALTRAYDRLDLMEAVAEAARYAERSLLAIKHLPRPRITDAQRLAQDAVLKLDAALARLDANKDTE